MKNGTDRDNKMVSNGFQLDCKRFFFLFRSRHFRQSQRLFGKMIIYLLGLTARE